MEKSNQTSKDGISRRKKNYAGFQYRRRSKVNCSVQYSADLQHVLGLTLKSNCSFACDSNTSLLAYPAGCVIVLHNPRNDRQQFIFNPGQKTITCLKFSCDGNFIATGESGHQPCVRVFSVLDRNQVSSVPSHKYGVSCVAFSPNSKYVISIGYQHDNVINVWDWKRNVIAASNKVSTKVKSVAFSECSNYFVTVGNRHVKFWYLEKASTPDNCTVPLKGRSAILETLRNHMFCDVVCGVGSDSQMTFAISKSGLLCQFNAKRTIARHIELKSGSGRTICVVNDMILCGCGNGFVYIFSANNLELITEISPPNIVNRQEVLAMAIDVYNMWLHLVFSDHTLMISDVMNLHEPHISSLSQFHSSCVSDVKMIPDESAVLSKDSFLTCSNDGTVRIWKIEEKKCVLQKLIHLEGSTEKQSDLENPVKVEARSICIRHDAKHVAIGDRKGNIHVYDLDVFERISFIPTHDGDILSMDYSRCGTMLASASRDRCVHMFTGDYVPTHTIADHSASVTSVKFSHRDKEVRLMSCGADKSLYFCAVLNNCGKTEISREQHFVEKHSMGDMTIIDDSVIVACGSNLSEYDIFGARLKRSFRGNEASSTILRVATDNQGTLLATSCLDKNIYLLAYMTGECVCVINGHSEVAVSLAFDNDSHLISTSADSCIFVWNLSHRVAEDTRQLPKLSNTPSEVSTPESDLNKTSYFGTHDDFNVDINNEISTETPPSVADDLISFADDFVSGSPSSLTFDNYADAERGSKSAESMLPAWVTKHLSSDDSALLSSKPSPAIGKWGDKLHKEKICEEIENLAQVRDLLSTVSSYDDESVVSELCHDIDLEEKIHPPSDGTPVNTNFSDEDEEHLSSTEDHHLNATYTKNDFMKLKKNEKQELDSTQLNEELKNVDDEVGEKNSDRISQNTETFEVSNDDLIDEKEVSQTNFAVVSKILDENAALCRKIEEGLEPVVVEPTVFAQTPDITNSFEHVDIRALIFSKSPTKPATRARKDDSINHFDTSKVTNQENSDENKIEKHKTVETEEDRLENMTDISTQNENSQGENQGINSDLNQAGENQITESRSITTRNKEELTNTSSESMKKTYVSKSVFNINLSPRREIPSSPSVSKEEELDVVTSRLVEEVISAAESSCDEDSEEEVAEMSSVTSSTASEEFNKLPPTNNDEQNHEPDNKTHLKQKTETSFGGESVISMQNGHMLSPSDNKDCSVEETKEKHVSDVVVKDEQYIDNIVSEDESNETLVANDNLNKPPDEEISENKESSSVLLTPTSKKQAIPPAFAELLDSLRKKRTLKLPISPPKTLQLKKNYDLPHGGAGESGYSTDATLNFLDKNEQSFDKDELDQETNNNYINGNHGDATCECEKASEDLLAVFNHAQDVYNKQKCNPLNGNHHGVKKLAGTFRSIQQKISNLNLSTHISMESLNDDSPVVSLLREYSDRLVDIVHTQVTSGKVLENQTDTL